MLEKVYVEVRRNKANEGFFDFGCTGYGWVYKHDLLNDNARCINVQCEDRFEGTRGWITSVKDIRVSRIQKVCPYKTY